MDPKSPGSYSGFFRHELFQRAVDAHARWWPCAAGSQLRTVLLFIPGNPGLIDFYIPFLSALHRTPRKDGLAILAHAHLGHTPSIASPRVLSLSNQVDAAIETFDTIRACWPHVKVVLVGHSVGSWITTQAWILHCLARPDSVDALFLLFPTISDIAKTPNGKHLSWLFHPPFPSVISGLSVLIRPVSAPILSLLFPSWPTYQKAVLLALVCSPSAIFETLTMSHDEMRIITTPEIPLLTQHASKLWFYYADKDDWVGQERERVAELLGDSAAIVYCRVPHAFCILHSDLVAAQCVEWLKQGGFVED
ncbi:alpha/beta-hydrolase [Ramaria rubella]|nr:alpha/beta-hydrolase [Ramaria rubella]